MALHHLPRAPSPAPFNALLPYFCSLNPNLSPLGFCTNYLKRFIFSFFLQQNFTHHFLGNTFCENIDQQFSECGPQTSREQHHLGPCEKCKFLGPTPDLLNQKLWAWGPALQVILCSLKFENHRGFSTLMLLAL